MNTKMLGRLAELVNNCKDVRMHLSDVIIKLSRVEITEESRLLDESADYLDKTISSLQYTIVCLASIPEKEVDKKSTAILDNYVKVDSSPLRSASVQWDYPDSWPEVFNFITINSDMKSYAVSPYGNITIKLLDSRSISLTKGDTLGKTAGRLYKEVW